MKKGVKKFLPVVFCVLLPLLLLLLSYKLVFGLSSYSAEQQEVMNFLEGGKLTSNMTAEEAAHLGDVKGVMDGVDYVFYALLLICTLIFTYAHREKKFLGKLLFYGGTAGVGLVLLLGIFALLNFRLLFKLFHQLFFPQGNWMFASSSFLITTFPLNFFIGMLWKIVLLHLVVAILFIVWGRFLKK